MSDNEPRQFELGHPDVHGNWFLVKPRKAMNVGAEGQKYFAEISSYRGTHGDFFVKPLGSQEYAEKQSKRYKHFKNGGVNTPASFKTLSTTDGRWYAVIEDLTNNGSQWVLGMNNPEVSTEEFKNTVLKISETSRKRIISDMIKACETAVSPNTEIGGKDTIYSLANNAFLMTIDPKDPEKVNIIVGDLGDDITEYNTIKTKSTLDSNIKNAAVFYTWMTGKKFEFPEKYKYLESEMVMGNNLDEILEYRRFKK